MNVFKDYDDRRHERQMRWFRELHAWRNARVVPVTDWTFTAPDGATHQLQVGDAWPVVDANKPVTLTTTVTIPGEWAGQPVEIELWLGGEGFVRFTPGYQTGLNPFHQDFRLTDAATGGETITVEAEVMPKGFFGTHNYAPAISRALLAIPHDQVRALERDLRNLMEAADQLKDHEIYPHLLDLVDAAYKALAPAWPTSTEIAKTRYISGDVEGGNRLDIPGPDYRRPSYQGGLLVSGIWHIPPATGSLEPISGEAIAATHEARAIIASRLAELKTQYPPIGNVLLTGHAHIDLAWLWPVAETRRKARRTFSSVLRLMDQYEDFTFNQSSAQAYVWIEQDDPELLKRIQERVKEGRWEPVGGQWLEPDSQVTGGEAFVRHLFYGQRTFERLFNLRNNTAWLPDVFGFSASVPQLLLGAGIHNFFTIKVTWNETNAFPYDLFHWEGNDGSRVLAHTFYNPGEGYNGNIVPLDTYQTWKAFKGKRTHDQTLLSIGWGDGGGGPSEEMLENYARIKDYPVLPRLQFGKVEDFFARLPTENLPTFVGELYLELHRATLTTQALVKKLNRFSEHRLAEAEAFAALASRDDAESQYPHAELDKAWQTLLLNQFHDILPGSSIHEVYQDTHPELQGVVATATTIRDRSIAGGDAAGDSGSIAVANPTLYPRTLSVVLPEGLEAPADLPAQEVEGGTLIHDVTRTVGGFATDILGANNDGSASPSGAAVRVDAANGGAVIENDRLRVEIGADGTIHRLFDKRENRETLADRANQLWAYVDRPRAWDAWDIDETYDVAGEEITAVDAIEIVEEGPLRAAVRVSRTWRNSTFVQTYRLLAGSNRLDIASKVDWHERLMLVRALFPTTIHAHEATFETMFGVQRRTNHRNTSWDRAKFEVGAHRFVDLSEPHYGVALLNDSKYGFSVLGGTIGVSLVRGPLYPDPFADEGEHEFTYSVFPHQGNWVDGGVTQEARALNSPLVAVPAGENAQSRESFVTVDGVELGFAALKKAHDRDGLVLRVYEPHGDRGPVTLAFDQPVTSVRKVNLLEEDVSEGELTVENGKVTFDVRPFEVVSLLIS
ncbi:MAG TPA: glycoside hydrolase family 38 C-terminal domain-containing protein [Thermomicrobiales bacterium]|nr:glycoside hydrolase family 38 C-terminal domain-containing protein [Thermomicrobiales bacterium]